MSSNQTSNRKLSPLCISQQLRTPFFSKIAIQDFRFLSNALMHTYGEHSKPPRYIFFEHIDNGLREPHGEERRDRIAMDTVSKQACILTPEYLSNLVPKTTVYEGVYGYDDWTGWREAHTDSYTFYEPPANKSAES